MLPRHADDAYALLRACARAAQTVTSPLTRMRQRLESSQLRCGALLPRACGGAVWSILLWSAVSCPYPMLREAHRNQFNPALEVAGSALGERPRRKEFKYFRSRCRRPFLEAAGTKSLCKVRSDHRAQRRQCPWFACQIGKC